MNFSWKSFLQPAFLICVLVLGLAASSKEYVIHKYELYIEKYPIPLQKPLSELDETQLAPYVVHDKARITNRDILESLGTDEYLQWLLEDPDAAADSPARFCSLFITYYTGNPDMVPHVPDECYVGGGNRRMSGQVIEIPLTFQDHTDTNESDSPALPLPEILRKTDSIGAQYVQFSRISTGGLIPIEENFSVQYFFKANGEYSAGRMETRAILGKNFTNKYSYFCKVEWKFYGQDFSGLIYPDRTQTIEASSKLLTTVLPVLERDHWPDWAKANQRTQSIETE